MEEVGRSRHNHLVAVVEGCCIRTALPAAEDCCSHLVAVEHTPAEDNLHIAAAAVVVGSLAVNTIAVVGSLLRNHHLGAAGAAGAGHVVGRRHSPVQDSKTLLVKRDDCR